MAQPSLTDAISKAMLESYIGSLIVQAFLSGNAMIFYGLYTFILYRTVRGAASCVALNKLNDLKILQIGNDTGMAAGFIADALLAWRCYILWQKNNWLLASFGFLLLGESALMTTAFVIITKHNIFPGFLIISMVITVLTTSMIIYRILTVSREAGTARRYRYIIEILVESGIGIAPTLIAKRVMNSTEKDEEKWSQPISTLRFRHTTQRGETYQESHVVNPPSPC
ncbi:hypothetical protein BDQ17DRAFT_1335934 [Cyathus striatus]|nr:hypothetical protein BDQ17DRAFT_1335934 [Cyathus striatus]